MDDKAALNLLIDYISGASIAAVRNDVVTKALNRKAFRKVKLYSGEYSALDNEELRPLIVKLFTRLNIKDEAVIRELLERKKNLYAIIKALLKQQHSPQQNTYQLKRFIELINERKEKKSINWRRRIKISLILLTLGSIVFAIFKPQTYARILESSKQFLINSVSFIIKNATWMNSLAFFGAMFSVIAALIKLAKVLFSHTKSASKKAKSAFFALLDGGMNTTAYVFAIRAGCFCTPATTGLFVAASAIGILKSAYSLFHRYKEYHAHYPDGMPDSHDWGERAAFIRSRNSYQQHQATLVTKIVGGVLLTGVIAMWCIFPPSILVTACCLVASAFILPKLQSFIVKKLKRHYQEKLQKELSDIEGEETLSLNTYPDILLQQNQAEAPSSVPTLATDKGNMAIVDRHRPGTPPPPYTSVSQFFASTGPKDISHDSVDATYANASAPPLYDELTPSGEVPPGSDQRVVASF